MKLQKKPTRRRRVKVEKKEKDDIEPSQSAIRQLQNIKQLKRCVDSMKPRVALIISLFYSP